jgi:hypothetical protein
LEELEQQLRRMQSDRSQVDVLIEKGLQNLAEKKFCTSRLEVV